MARIAVIEDEEAIRNLIIEELDDCGHETFSAENGEQGLEVILENNPDLILSDITMPKLNGRQLLRKLRENHPTYACTPFIFLSALADQNDVIKGLRIGADDYVTKPIDFDMLLARIDARLRMAARLNSEDDDDIAENDLSSDVSSSVASTDDAVPSVDHDSPAEANEKISKTASRNDGKLIAGHIETISMQEIRRKCGDDWRRISKRVVRIAEETIRKHLANSDVFSVTSTNDFMICFSEGNAQFAKSKVEEIAEDIRNTLFGETQSHEVSQVKAKTQEIQLSPAEVADKKSLFSRVKGKILSKSKKLLNSVDQKLITAYQNEFIHVSTVFTINGDPTRMKAADFAPETSSKINKWTKPGNVPSSTLLELDMIMLSRVVSLAATSPKTASPTMLVTLHYSTVDDEQLLDRYAQAYGSIDIDRRRQLVLSVVGLPEKLKAGGSPFDRLAGLGRTRAVHIEGPQHFGDFDFKALNVGIGLINHRAAIDFRDRGIKPLVQKMKSAGARLIIRDVLSDSAPTPKELGAGFVLGA